MALGQGKKNAPSKSNATPAPVKAFDPTAHDRTFGRTNYQSNGSEFPASIPQGMKVSSPLADDLSSGDDVLKTVARQGTCKSDTFSDATKVEGGKVSSQLRAISDKNVPDAFGSASARKNQAGGGDKFTTRLPAQIDKSQEKSAPVRKPPSGA